MVTMVAVVVSVADTLMVLTPSNTVGSGKIPQFTMSLLMFKHRTD
jgi:hypothetical protein